jgi:SAM-dependent methyltransferase
VKITKIARLPEYLRTLRRDLNTLSEKADSITAEIHSISAQIADMKQRTDKMEYRLNELGQRDSELEHMLNVSLHIKNGLTKETKDHPEARFVDNHLLDKFYLELENNLRGTEDEVKTKQKVYLSLFKQAQVDYKEHPVIDLGAGRGEFLALLQESNIRGIGVDLNESMVKRIISKNIEAVTDDATGYLEKAKSDSLGAIVGFHIAEHLPFNQLVTLISEARRTLVEGGFLLLETPNPENLSVGAFTFHYDPSHLKPIPPALLEFVARFKGFEATEVMRLQPELDQKEINRLVKENKQLAEVYKRLFGPRDYALVAYK